MDLSVLEEALIPYEKKLRAQERLRRFLRVKEVERPTYEKYIIGPVGRFDRRKNANLMMRPGNPFGEEFRKRFKAKTGYEHYRGNLPYSELEPEDRIGQALADASSRLYREYKPDTISMTPADGRAEVTDKVWVTRLIKKAALFFGAEMVRITEVDQRWVYQDLDIRHPYVIVIVVSHVPSLIRTAPSHLSRLSNSDAYSRLQFIATQLADFISLLGYDAAYRETRAHAPEMLMVPTAIDAGIGEFCRSGRVLSPEFGPNMRLKPVTTDLPLEVDKPISFGVHEFCMVCDNCATYCPVRAIPFGPPTDEPLTIQNNPGYHKWYVNAERCLTFWALNKKKWITCGGRCIAVCPWNKELNTFHNTVRWMAIHSPMEIKKLLVRADKRIYQRKTGTFKPKLNLASKRTKLSGDKDLT